MYWFLKIMLCYRDMEEQLNTRGLVGVVDGLLLDFGVSSMQLDTADRGFSFLRDGPLDMRMDTKQGLSALEVVNTWPEQDLGSILREFGEEKMWRSVARRIADARCAALEALPWTYYVHCIVLIVQTICSI
jgi:16S rRNA (cytosine1402-N4)-methyltransferase